MNISQLLFSRQIPAAEDGAIFQLALKSQSADYEMQSTIEHSLNSAIPFFTASTDIPANIGIERKGKYVYLTHIFNLPDGSADSEKSITLAHSFVMSTENFYQICKVPQQLPGFCSPISEEKFFAAPAELSDLEELPSNSDSDLDNTIKSYFSDAAYAETLLRCVYTTYFSNSNDALHIVVPDNCPDINRFARDIMSVIYSFMPYSIRLNLSFSSACGKIALGKNICFAKSADEHTSFFNISTGEYHLVNTASFLQDAVIDFCVKADDLPQFFDSIEEFCYAYSDKYSTNRATLQMGEIYYHIKKDAEFQHSDEVCISTLSDILSADVKEPPVIDAFIAGLLLHVLNKNIRLEPELDEKLTERIKNTDVKILKQLEVLNNARLIGYNCDDSSFEKLYSLRTEPDGVYATTLKYLTLHSDGGFLDKYYARCYLAKNHSSYNDICDTVALAKKLTLFPETQSAATEYFLEHFAIYTSCDYFDYKLFEQSAAECFGDFPEVLEDLLRNATELYWKRFDCSAFDISKLEEYRSMYNPDIAICKDYKILIDFAESLDKGIVDNDLFADASAILAVFFPTSLTPAQCDIMIYKLRGILLKKRLAFNLDTWLLLYYSNKEKAINFEKMFTNIYHSFLFIDIFSEDASKLIRKSEMLKDPVILESFLNYIAEYVRKQRPSYSLLEGFNSIIVKNSKTSSSVGSDNAIFNIAVILCILFSAAIIIHLIIKYLA